MLLAGDADAVHACAVDLGGDLPDNRIQRSGPLRRMLLHVAGRQAGDEGVRGAGLGDDLAGHQVKDDGLGALRAAVDADEEPVSHGGSS